MSNRSVKTILAVISPLLVIAGLIFLLPKKKGGTYYPDSPAEAEKMRQMAAEAAADRKSADEHRANVASSVKDAEKRAREVLPKDKRMACMLLYYPCKSEHPTCRIKKEIDLSESVGYANEREAVQKLPIWMEANCTKWLQELQKVEERKARAEGLKEAVRVERLCVAFFDNESAAAEKYSGPLKVKGTVDSVNGGVINLHCSAVLAEAELEDSDLLSKVKVDHSILLDCSGVSGGGLSGIRLTGCSF